MLEKQINRLLKAKYKNEPTENFYKDIKRLEKGEPLDYVIGFTEFLGCKIDLSKKPLIPRQETEFWVGKAIEDLKNRKPFDTGHSAELSRSPQGKILHILDIFAGSGCIGIFLSRHVKNAEVTFAEKEKKLLEQIKINLKINGVRGRVVQSDVFKGLNPSSLRLLRTKYDFVFANPPYIAQSRKNKVGKSVLKYEPKTALFGGNDGLFYIRKFLKEAKNHLNKSGVIFMEFDGSASSPQAPSQKKEIKKLVEKYKYSNCEFHKDQYNRWRWVEIH